MNDSLEKNAKLDGQFSYDLLSKNELVNNLMKKYKTMADTPSTSGKPDEAVKEDETSKKKKRLGKNVNKNVSLRSKVENCDTILYPSLNPCLTEKLDEVLNQGILDSFLPFICPQQPIPIKVPTPSSCQPVAAAVTNPTGMNLIKTKQMIVNQNKSIVSIDKKMSSTELGSGIIFSQRSLRKKSPIVLDQTKCSAEPELTIHVCDEVKGVSRDFTCPQKLLVSKMGYFADITSGQKLEGAKRFIQSLDVIDIAH